MSQQALRRQRPARLVSAAIIAALAAPGSWADFVYFAAEVPPSNSERPPDSSLCYRFQVDSLEAQLGKLTLKYPDALRNARISDAPAGGRVLTASRTEDDGRRVEYYYSERPDACDAYQEQRGITRGEPVGSQDLAGPETVEPTRAAVAASGDGDAEPAPNASTAPSQAADSGTSATSSDPVAELLEKAAGGDAAAQFDLAVRYFRGDGVSRDYEEGAAWMLKGAEQGHAEAQHGLALVYAVGKGVPKDFSETASWLRKAAEQRHADAQAMLGLAYAQGEGVPQSFSEAASWSRKAAEQGHPVAQNQLGTAYERGEGVPQDFSEAASWYRKAADQGEANAQYNLGALHYRGKGVPQDLSAAALWYRKAAEQGHVLAQNNLGLLYRLGDGVPRDDSEAASWLRKAADQGEANAQYNLGALYHRGKGVPQDFSEAAFWYRKAAEQGVADGQNDLGVLYRRGDGVPQDDSEAASWFRKAAEQGNTNAQENLGDLYSNGYGVERNDAWAVYWYAKSAQQGSVSVLPKLEDGSRRLQGLRVTGNGVNVRSRPGTDSEALAAVSKGDIVYRTDTLDSGWTEVYVPRGHYTGFIASRFLKEDRVDSPRRQAASNAGPYPPAPPPRPGYVTCRTNCYNADCYRTYSDGRRVNFQAQMKWDTFSNSFTYDSGGC